MPSALDPFLLPVRILEEVRDALGELPRLAASLDDLRGTLRAPTDSRALDETRDRAGLPFVSKS